MKKLITEPFFHFILLGAALFLVNEWRQRQKPGEDVAPRIEVTAAVIERLSAGYQRQFGREPDENDVRGLVAAHIREEILYREAMSMGLDRDDTIVRRRMAQKMEFLTDDIAGQQEPDDTVLQAYFSENAASYADSERVSFKHVFFSPQKRGSLIVAAARQALVALKDGASDEQFGDSFLHGYEFPSHGIDDVTALFGKEFAHKIVTLTVGAWHGPVPSSYGLHLVRVDARSDAKPATFEKVRATVLRDYAEERRLRANREVYERLKERYEVIVDESAFTASDAPPTETAQRTP